MKDPQKFQKELPLRERANAIYMEPDFIACVRASNVRAEDWGINALIIILPTPRMRDEGEPSYRSVPLGTYFLTTRITGMPAM